MIHDFISGPRRGYSAVKSFYPPLTIEFGSSQQICINLLALSQAMLRSPQFCSGITPQSSKLGVLLLRNDISSQGIPLNLQFC